MRQIMNKRTERGIMAKRLLCVLIALLSVFALCACSDTQKEELKSELPALIERGRELLDIVYGSGLPIDASADESFRAGYVRVSDDSPYKSLDELKSAIDEVFGIDYATVLYISALNGVSYDDSSIGARYIENDGVLYAKLENEINAVKRTPNYDSIEITRINRYMAEFTMDMTNENGEIEKDSFTLVCEDGAWRLDSVVL